MFGHTSVSPKQTTVDSRQRIMDTAKRVAAIMTEANKRLFKLQTEAAYAAFADNLKDIDALHNAAKSPAALTEWLRLYQESAQKMVDLTRSWFDIASQTQAELGKLLGEPFAPFNVRGAEVYRPVCEQHYRRAGRRRSSGEGLPRQDRREQH